MSIPLQCRIKPFLQPFEQRLALEELKSLAGDTPKKVRSVREPGVFRVNSRLSPSELVNRLAYWEVVDGGIPEFTLQALGESTVNVVRNGIPPEELRATLPFGKNVPLPNRRCLRYASHGIHEYRGKFFPQLVRSLINCAGLSPGEIVGDPMCGSGTTVVEAALAGMDGFGLDMNPLSVLLSRTKCALLGVSPKVLERSYLELRDFLLHAPSGRQYHLKYVSQLPDTDQAYLNDWFSEQSIADLDLIATRVSAVRNDVCRDFFTVCLSNIIRRVSWQKEDDLRVRKHIKPDSDIDPIREFLEEMGRSVRFVLAFLHQFPDRVLGKASVRAGDARDVVKVWKQHKGRVSAFITSPPYATALPYLDTDRLSLIFLKLLPRSVHRITDTKMIGNREITERGRRELLEWYQTQRNLLPTDVTYLIDRIDTLNANGEVGFRRRNMSALLAKYFLDMRAVLQGMHGCLKSGGRSFLVVGNNHTVAGGERVEIGTVDLLRQIAESVGFTTDGVLPMEMLVSRDIFKKNAISSESILSFSKKRL